jgi:hypothetical protein
MKKVELIASVRRQLGREAKTRGETAFLGFFAEYLRRLEIEHDEKYDFHYLTPYLPQIIGDAFEDFRTNDADWATGFRIGYESETGYYVPNLMQIGDGDNVFRSIVTTNLGILFREITEMNHVEGAITSYLNAEMATLQLFVDKFLRLVYRKGLYDLVIKTGGGGMNGRFGDVDLRCFITAGRVMFTFARQVGESETSVTFIAEDGDPNAYSAGIQSALAPLSECMAMIDEVIANWPSDGDEQAKQFTSSDSVMIDVMAAMKQAS